MLALTIACFQADALGCWNGWGLCHSHVSGIWEHAAHPCGRVTAGWDKWDQPWGHGHREEGTCHPRMCWVTVVPVSVGSIPPSPSLPERWECHRGSRCPMGQGGRVTMGCPLRSCFPFPALLSIFVGTAVSWEASEPWMCAGMDAGKKGKKKKQERGEGF